MECNNINFTADKVKPYAMVREAMAKVHPVDKPTFFGPPTITELGQEDSDNKFCDYEYNFVIMRLCKYL